MGLWVLRPVKVKTLTYIIAITLKFVTYICSSLRLVN